MAAPSAWSIKFTAGAKPGIKVKRSLKGANSKEKKKMRLIYEKEKHPSRAYNPKWKFYLTETKTEIVQIENDKTLFKTEIVQIESDQTEIVQIENDETENVQIENEQTENEQVESAHTENGQAASENKAELNETEVEMESEIVENISDSKGDSGDESDSEFEFEQTEEQNMFFLQKYACER
jgi:hypothetical protein